MPLHQGSPNSLQTIMEVNVSKRTTIGWHGVVEVTNMERERLMVSEISESMRP
jgi:3-deoxy-D-arabino-heptulosonate 7-phosphate (DAHP) synthase